MTFVVTTGTNAPITATITNPAGIPVDASGALDLLVVDPLGGEITYEGTSVIHDSTGHYHVEVPAPISGLYHWRWYVEGALTGEGEFQAESEFDSEYAVGEVIDLLDLMVIVPKARRKVEGPWGNPNNRPRISTSVLYNMVADAAGDTMMLAGSWWHNKLLVKSRDPLGGFPVQWQTQNELTEWEASIICCQLALDYYTFLFRDLKTSETLKNEGTEWSYTISANVLRNYLIGMKEERDKAIAGLRVNIPVFDKMASNIRVRDQATIAVLEWWDINSPGLTGGGLPGGQEATSIPWFPGPG